MAEPKKTKELPEKDRAQRSIFKKTRGGEVLTKNEVLEIKAGRKKLRADLKKVGIKSKKEFEVTASGMGLYFDKNKKLAMFLWFMSKRGGWLLLALGALALGALYLFSMLTEYRGHFTISMSDDMFKAGFSISDSEDFKKPTSHLFCTPAENVPCISIIDIPENVNDVNATHTGNYFVYTFYVRNEGETKADYKWTMSINSESKDLSEAAWMMIFEGDEMTFYAKANEFGRPESIPATDVLAQSEYTPESWQKLMSAYENAKTVEASAQSQDTINAAAARLKSAIDSLVFINGDQEDQINYDELIGLLTRASMLKKEDFTEETWAELQKQIKEAEKLVDKAKTQESVNLAISKIRAAIFNAGEELEEDELNFTELEMQISRVFGDDAYIVAPLQEKCKFPDDQYEIIKQTTAYTYYKLIPKPFVSETVAAEGLKKGVKPNQIDEYTVVIWLEGDDPDCTNDLIGGHLGLEVYLELIE